MHHAADPHTRLLTDAVPERAIDGPELASLVPVARSVLGDPSADR
jgi:hypothetical protein